MLAIVAHPDEHIPADGVNAGHGAGQQLLGLGGVVLVHGAPLGLPDALDDDLLGGLGGDAAEGGYLHRDADHISQLRAGIHVPGGVQGHLGGGVLHLLHHGPLLGYGHFGFRQLHHHVFGGDLLVILPVLPVGVYQSLLDPLHHVVNGDVPLLLQRFQGAEDHIGLAKLRLGIGFLCISGHDSFLLIRIPRGAAPERPPAFQR